MTETTEKKPAYNPLIVAGDRNRPTSTRCKALIEAVDGAGLLEGLPNCITPERVKRTFLVAIRKNPKLLNCTPESLLECIQEAGTLGLEFGGTLGHAYLVPFKEQCVLIPGYRGLADLARRYDKILIKTRCVFTGDEFEYEEGDTDFIRHKPDQSPDATFRDEDITHVYLIAKREETGTVICRSVWTKAQVEAHKQKYSKGCSKPDSGWVKNWQAMARKTLIRETINRGELPVSSEIQRLAVRSEHVDMDALEIEPDYQRLESDEQPPSFAELAGESEPTDDASYPDEDVIDVESEPVLPPFLEDFALQIDAAETETRLEELVLTMQDECNAEEQAQLMPYVEERRKALKKPAGLF